MAADQVTLKPKDQVPQKKPFKDTPAPPIWRVSGATLLAIPAIIALSMFFPPALPASLIGFGTVGIMVGWGWLSGIFTKPDPNMLPRVSREEAAAETRAYHAAQRRKRQEFFRKVKSWFMVSQ